MNQTLSWADQEPRCTTVWGGDIILPLTQDVEGREQGIQDHP